MTQKEEEKMQEVLQQIAQDIKEKLPENMGFALLTYEFENAEEGRKLMYISNTQRVDVLNVMASFIQRNLDDQEVFGEDSKEDVSL